jgi:hypothetical protein
MEQEMIEGGTEQVAPDNDQEFTEDDRKRLNELQRIQTNGEFTKEEREDFLRLSAKFEKENKGGLTEAEQQEYAELTIRQANSDGWGRKESDRFIVLQNKLDKKNRSERGF